MSDCSLLTPLRRDGTSQRQRMPGALDPGFARVDERSTADLLLYAAELGRLLRFYNEANEPAGDWAEFLERDVSTLAARIGAAETDAVKAEFDAKRAAADAATAAGFPAALAALMAPVFALADTFESWRRGAIEGLQLRARLDRLIEGVLADALQDTIRAAKRAGDIGPPLLLPGFAGFGDAWGDLDPPPDLALFESGGFADADERKRAVDVVARAFERFYETGRRLAAQAAEFLADTLAHYPAHRPHAALFLAFLRLFNQARHSLNTVTARHLDFYYRDVLRLVPRGPVADRVHVTFELAKSFAQSVVPKDTRLNAGKDATNVPLVYGADTELVVNRAILDPLHGLKTVFIDLGPGDVVRNVHAAPDADSADGVGTPLDPPDAGWPTFGTASLPYARVGFAVASPMLWLAEGTRRITVRLEFAPSSALLAGRDAEVVRRELMHNVVIEVTGAKGWIAPRILGVTLSASAAFVQYQLEVPAGEPPVVALDPTLHADTFDTRYPVLRFVLNNRGLPGELLASGPPEIADFSDEIPSYLENDIVRFEGRLYQASQEIDRPGFRPALHPDKWNAIPYANPYKYIERTRIEGIKLTVAVTDMRSLILESDVGALNPAKPFQPFGPAPREGASFLVGSWEVFQKQLTRLTLGVTWAGLPTTQNFKDHYAGYPLGTQAIPGNGYFTADIEILKNGGWDAKDSSVALFGTSTTAAPEGSLTRTLMFTPAAPELHRDAEFPRDPALDPIRRFEPGLERGFVRFKLNKGFLHELYPGALAAFAKGTTTTPPNPPYTPTISSLKLAYTAEETIDYPLRKREDVERRVERVFQIGPFGQQEIVPVTAEAATPDVVVAYTPVPRFTVIDDAGDMAEGTLYLGVARLAPPQNLSLLFQMAEGSEDPLLPAQEVRWGYLTASGWKDFARAGILSDTTSGLIASGIVQLAVPRAATSTATLLPGGLHWLRATVRRSSAAVPKAVAVLPQAVQATFRDDGNDPRHLAVPLPAQTIGKLVEREAAIKSLAQPFSSFGARMAESDPAFRLRVSERLRHKRRAVTIFDYERLVLDRFPEVYKVRCLSHTGPDSEYAPGFVRVVVVPNLRNKNAIDPLRPRLSLARLEEIRRYLDEIASDFADLEVINPEYEEVRVRFNVRFKRGYDKGHYIGQLEQDIIRFLSPWLYDEGVDLSFGGRVHRSSILNFIDEREYVDFVADFEMDHIVGGATRTNVEEAEPTRSSAVIVPAKTHEVGDAITSCEDEPPSGGLPAPVELPPPIPPSTPRYLGNVVKRELHDLMNLTPYCQVDEIAIDRRYRFRRIEDALALGYDFCAYCFGRELSRR